MENEYNGDKALAYCRELTRNGEKLTFTWDGGNDEGYIRLFVNDQPLDESDDATYRLLIYLEQSLGYGSFAGNFHTEGKCEFDREDGWFTGTGTYSEDKEELDLCDFKLQVPSDFWFDELNISIRGEYDCSPTVALEFEILNGPIHNRCDQLEKDLQAQLEKDLDKFVSEFDEYVSLWHDMQISINEFIEKEGLLTYTITEMPYNYEDCTEDLIMIDFSEDYDEAI